jgi:phosphatidylglycerophosphatase A
MENIKQKAIIFLATGGLIGYSPIAPGTFGSAAALPLCLLISLMPISAAMVFVAALLLFSVWIAHGAQQIIGRSDPPEVVVDEICGMAVTMLALPFSPVFVVGGFALFRVFDILKPFPIRWVDKHVPGGLGILLDDLLAGIFANAILRGGMVIFR